MFDCNHARTDLVPYAAFTRTMQERRAIGSLAAPPAPRGPCGERIRSGSTGMLQLPTPNGPMQNAFLATYKDYDFVYAELTSLTAQLAARS